MLEYIGPNVASLAEGFSNHTMVLTTFQLYWFNDNKSHIIYHDHGQYYRANCKSKWFCIKMNENRMKDNCMLKTKKE